MTCHLDPDSVASELARTLRRYERLCSMPRHLQFPLVGDLDACSRAERTARAAGNTHRANELGALIEAEYERRDRAYCWRTGTFGRSAAAWAGIQCRLWNARAAAVATGLLERGAPSYVFVSDRLRDIEFRLERARRFERTVTIVVAPAVEWCVPGARA